MKKPRNGARTWPIGRVEVLFMKIGPTLSALALLSCANGCFLGYDSRWGETKRIQQHAAAAAAPASLATESAPAHEARTPAARTYRVRMYATAAYATQRLDWHKRATELVEDANRVLAPSLGAQLVIEDMRDWSTDEKTLNTAHATLRERDDGRDVDWVIGLVGALPRETASFHELGMGSVIGKHVVVRAISPSQERDAIDRTFTELSDEERTKLAKTRARHRATAVLLHEIGHTLAGVHTQDPRSLMHARYDGRMEAYGEPSLALMRASLAHREDADARGLATALLPILESAPAETWVEDDRVALANRLHAVDAPREERAPAQAAKAEPPAEAPLPADVMALAEDARARYAETSRALAAGDAAKAREVGAPLFAKARDSMSVQDLRCKVSMAMGDDWPTTRAECNRLMELSTAPAPTRK